MILHKNIFLSLGLIVLQSITSAQITRPIGINLAGINDYSSEFVFVDAFKQCRKWISFDASDKTVYDTKINVALDVNGYPLEIPASNGVNPPQSVRTLLFFSSTINGAYPNGKYRFIVKGSGKITFSGGAAGTYNCPVDTFINVNNSKGGIIVTINSSLKTNHISEINFVMPGFENTFQKNKFHPDLLSFIKDFQVLRFMDQMHTNGSPVTSWSTRNTRNYYSQSLNNGVAYEHIINLCNQTKKDAWICIPHKATDEFITEMAKLFRDSLDAGLKIYLEYSNELWNGQFEQSQYISDQGALLGYVGKSWEQGWLFTVKRSADVFRLFEIQFGKSNRLVKVIPSQSANSWLTNYLVEHFNDIQYNPTLVKADAIAIAPYFGNGIADKIGKNGTIDAVTIDNILDSLELKLPGAYTAMDENKAVAQTHALKLIAYEGGQHLIASGTYQNNTTLTNKLRETNRNARMEDIYCSYFDYWYTSVSSDVFCAFASHGTGSKYGNWGIKEFMSDTLAPKYLGIKNCVFSHNSSVITSEQNKLKTNLKLIVYPSPSNGNGLHILHQLNSPNIEIIDITGKKIPFEIDSENNGEFVISVPNHKGIGIITLRDSKTILVSKILFN